ncbi:hypothetical protein WEH80_18630 [Actinomycetes bacterium KLBMP 9759]
MPSSQIVIVTDVLDEHVDPVIRQLVAGGHEPVRVNAGDIPLNVDLSVGLAGPAWTGSIRIISNGRTVDVADIRSVWWRGRGALGLASDLSAWEREFAEEEIRHATRGLWSTVDCHWVSHPDAIERAAYKMEQLSRAARLGFSVPRTLVSNDPEQVLAFVEGCQGGAVYKVLTDPFLRLVPHLRRTPDAEVTPVIVRTTRVDAGVRAALESVRGVPCQFQELVPKRSELRVTVIDDELFCAEVPTSDSAPLDWRVDGPDVDWRAAELPDEVARRCLALVASYGLAFGAIDLIHTPDGEYVFLEINPSGQFLFVQYKVPSLRMDEALAASLIRGRAGAP